MQPKNISLKIKILLLTKGLTQREIARRLGVTPGLISNVINGYASSQYVKEGLCKILEDPDLFNNAMNFRSISGERNEIRI